VNIVFLSRWFPCPVDNGSKIRIYNLLRGLAQRHDVSLISFYELEGSEPDVAAMREFCQDVRLIPWQAYRQDSWRARFGYFSKTPRAYVDTYSPAMAQSIADTLSSEKVDLVIASQIDTAIYAGVFRGVPAIFEEVELGVLYDQYFSATSFPARMRGGLTWLKHSRYVAQLVNHFRLCTVVSERERDMLLKNIRGNFQVEIIPNCIDLARYVNIHEQPQPDTLVFTGSITYKPNYDAVCWFLENIFPQLRLRIPGLRLVITGEHANLPLPDTQGVLLTGMVEDVCPLIARSWLSIVPLQTGGGTRLKVLESMALGTPVVSTAKGVEGLAVRDGVHLLIANDPHEYSTAVLRLLLSPGLRQQLVEQAHDLVRERYNWEIFLPRYLELVERVAGNSGSAGSGMGRLGASLKI